MQKAQIILGLIAALVGIALLVIIILCILAFIGVSPLGTGCFLRYTLGGGSESQSSINLMANGNYTTNISAEGTVVIDPRTYDKWKNTGWVVRQNEIIDLTASGDIQLCKAYLPLSNNLNSTTIPDSSTTKKILIPNTDTGSTIPEVELKFDASNCQWRNIAKLDFNDQIVVTLKPNAKPTDTSIGNIQAMKYTNPLTGATESADCSEGKTTYSPICGRYGAPTPVKFYYVSQCKQVDKCDCGDVVVAYRHRTQTASWKSIDIASQYHDNGDKTLPYPSTVTNPSIFESLSASTRISSTQPSEAEAVKICNNGWKDNPSRTVERDESSGFWDACCGPGGVSWHDYTYNYDAPMSTPNPRFWYTADDASALLYRFSDNDTPIDSARGNPASSDSSAVAINTGPGYRFASIVEGRKIFKYTHLDGNTKYLQFRPISNTCDANTGGYIIGIKQTKCRRSNGGFASDSFPDRGQVQYIIADFGQDLNTVATAPTPSALTFTNGATNFTANKTGMLWVKIHNNTQDVTDSSGQYTITKITKASAPSFNEKVIAPILITLKDMVTSGGQKMFKNMICYQSTDKSLCTNFFTYIKAMLTLYVAVFGAMFLLGMVQISQKDLVVRIIKIAIISGLISGQTFELFQTYVFDFVINFSNQIISNISGYNTFSIEGVKNPLMFTEELLSRIFFSPTFLAQLLATISFGIFGPFYFILLLIALVICIITILRAIAVYIMAFVAVALLLGLAPFFLVFMLFQQTYYLFENWSRFLFRYMIEPAILLVGIIILTKLFTIYLDSVLGYSVCWKCALEFKLPFPKISGLPTGILDVPLFCISWFGAWGLDSSNDTIGMNMSNIVGLIMIAYCMYGYTDFAGSLVTNLTNTPLAPGATAMGKSMSSAMGQAALGKVGLDSANRTRQLDQAEGNFNSKMQSAKGDE